MLEDLGAVAAHAPERSAGAKADAIKVSRDMEGIFGPALRPAGHAAAPVTPIVVDRPASGYMWIIAAALVALAGMLVAGGVAWMKPLPQPMAAISPTPAAKHTLPAPAAIRAPVTAAPRLKPASHRAARPKSAARCSRLSGPARARCMRPQILAADRQLRAAYARATRAGVGRRTLSVYRERWAHMRSKANSNPVVVTAAYRQMARQLDATHRRR